MSEYMEYNVLHLIYQINFFTLIGGGCLYKGQLYQQGEQWNDGCEYNCTCSDASRGYYVCRAL